MSMDSVENVQDVHGIHGLSTDGHIVLFSHDIAHFDDLQCHAMKIFKMAASWMLVLLYFASAGYEI